MRNNFLSSRPAMGDLLRGTVLTAMVFIVLFPLAITIFASLKTPMELGSLSPLTPPPSFSADNYIKVLKLGGIFRSFINTLILVVVSLLANTFLASSVAYCLNRFDFKLKKLIFFVFLMGMIVPTHITEISRFGIIKTLGLFNTRGAAILIYAGADMMQVYVYLQFMKQIPLSLDESASIDGLPLPLVYWKIILPLQIPAMATLGILKMVDIMNDMYIPFLYMPSTKLKTLTTNLMAAFAHPQLGMWNNLSAAIIVVMLPVTILYLVFQKQVMRGIMSGAVKG